jgi:hypothetical protein
MMPVDSLQITGKTGLWTGFAVTICQEASVMIVVGLVRVEVTPAVVSPRSGQPGRAAILPGYWWRGQTA